MTKAEFIDWKNSHVTKEVFSHLKARVDFLTEKLVDSAGQDPGSDSVARGYIAAYKDLLLIEYEDE